MPGAAIPPHGSRTQHSRPSRRIGVLAGAFNPVTRAHLALLESARDFTDELVCVVPRVYPHKTFEGAGFEERLEMLRLSRPAIPHGFTVHGARLGMFIEI